MHVNYAITKFTKNNVFLSTLYFFNFIRKQIIVVNRG